MRRCRDWRVETHARIQRGEGVGPPPENYKNINNTGLDTLTKTSQHAMLGHHLLAGETQFQWRFVGGPMIARFGSSLLSTKKSVVCVGPL